MGLSLPIIKKYKVYDSAGRAYIVHVIVEQANDLIKYPKYGIKSVFSVLKQVSLNTDAYQLVLLIDNHEPFGFHIHNDLPKIHNSRVEINIRDWKEAWTYFDVLVKELVNEA